MIHQEKRQRDPQRCPPRAYCSLCGGELYPGDLYWSINGATVCRACLGDYAAQFFAAHCRKCGEEGLP